MGTPKQTRKTPSRDIDAELGRRAHMLMWDRRLTIKQVAAQLEVDSTGLSKKLKGERGWALAEIVSLAGVLDTSVAYLAGESDEPSPVGPAGFEPTTSTVESRRFAEGHVAELIPLFSSAPEADVSATA